MWKGAGRCQLGISEQMYEDMVKVGLGDWRRKISWSSGVGQW